MLRICICVCMPSSVLLSIIHGTSMKNQVLYKELETVKGVITI